MCNNSLKINNSYSYRSPYMRTSTSTCTVRSNRLYSLASYRKLRVLACRVAGVTHAQAPRSQAQARANQLVKWSRRAVRAAAILGAQKQRALKFIARLHSTSKLSDHRSSRDSVCVCEQLLGCLFIFDLFLGSAGEGRVAGATDPRETGV